MRHNTRAPWEPPPLWRWRLGIIIAAGIPVLVCVAVVYVRWFMVR